MTAFNDGRRYGRLTMEGWITDPDNCGRRWVYAGRDGGVVNAAVYVRPALVEYLPEPVVFNDGDVVSWNGWLGRRDNGRWKWLGLQEATSDESVQKALTHGWAVRLVPQVTS